MANALKPDIQIKTAGRYRILERIGSGAFSEVYRAEKDGLQYAIKFVKNSTSDLTAVEMRFRREASALSRIDHPGVIKIEEVGRENDTPYVAMEYIDGFTLQDYLDKTEFNQDLILSIMIQICKALASVHALGMIHRDIKSENILISRDGKTVKLIDFGFTTGEAQNEPKDEIVGTLQYASPEQLGGITRVVDHRSDLYSLGIVFYRALTSKLPFESETISDLIRNHAATVPASPMSIRSEIKPQASQIIMKLLAKDPDDRYQSASGLAWDLEHLINLPNQAGTYSLDSKSHGKAATFEFPIVGRDEDIQTILNQIQKSIVGRGSFTLVEGPSGSGKTRLIREVLKSSELGSIAILEGKAQENEISPFSSLREAFDNYFIATRDNPETQKSLLKAAGSSGFLLRKLSRGLDQIFKDAPEIPALAPDIEKERFLSFLCDFMCTFADLQNGLVLHIGDIQWLDHSSREFLSKLSERISKSKISVLMTGRNDSESVETTKRIFEDLKSDSKITITLKALQKEHILEMIHLFLGSKLFDTKIVDLISNVSEGNPFAVTEYLRSMIDNGILFPKGERWEISEEEFSKVSVSKTVIQLVVERISKLNLNTRDLLEHAAIEGMKFKLSTLKGVLGEDVSKLYRTLEESLYSGFVSKLDDDRYQFVHDSIRESLLSNLSPARTQNINQKISNYLYQNCDKSLESHYQLSRFFLASAEKQDPRRLFEVVYFAGQYALNIYSDEEAFSFFETAHTLSQVADPQLHISVEEFCATASIRVGKFDKALDHLGRALGMDSAPLDYSRLLYLKATAQSAAGQYADSWQTVLEGLKELGSPFPKYRVTQVCKLLFCWASSLIYIKSGFRYGSSRGDDLTRRKLISQNYLLATFSTYFSGQVFELVQVIIYNLLNGHYIGTSPENVRAHGFYGFLMGLLYLRKPGRSFANSTVSMGEQLGDPNSITIARLFNAYISEKIGDLQVSDDVFKKILPDVRKYVNPREKSECYTAHIFQNVTMGRPQYAIDFYYKSVDLVDQWNNAMMKSNFRTCVYSELALTGRHKEAAKVRSEILALSANMTNVKFCMTYVYSSQIHVLLDRDDLGQEVEDNIQKFYDLKFDEHWNRYTYVLIGYVRLRQMQTSGSKVRAERLKALKKAVTAIRFKTFAPHHKCHLYIIQGYVYLEQGKHKLALRSVQKGLDVALQIGSNWGIYEAHLALARIHSEEKVKNHFIQIAFRLATEQGWVNRSNTIRKEFSLADFAAPERPTKSSNTILASRRSVKNENESTILQAVSYALSSSLDLSKQIQIALSEVKRILGSDRVVLFLEKNGELNISEGFSDDSGASLSTVSSKAVKQAFDLKKPILITDSKDAMELGSESIVINQLKSVLAVPMILKDEKKGVIYIDSLMTKGMFSEADIEILSVVSTQIAISFENGKLARAEAERKTLAKDLELSAAVQKLFLPTETKLQLPKIKMSGFYRPASQCGGDWWWYKALCESKLQLFVGDVTGHGAGPAMITASIASYTREYCNQKESRIPEILDMLNKNLYETAKGDYLMTLMGIEIDVKEMTLSYWSAGGPAFLVLNSSGEIRSHGKPGTPLGAGSNSAFGLEKIHLNQGDRIFVYTDGIVEMKVNDRLMGKRRLNEALKQLRSTEPSQANHALIDILDKFRGDSPQDDDFTFVTIDILGG